MKKIDGLIWRIVVLVLAILAAEAVSAWAKLPATKLRVPPTSGPEAPTLNGALACSNSSGKSGRMNTSPPVNEISVKGRIWSMTACHSSVESSRACCWAAGTASRQAVLRHILH